MKNIPGILLVYALLLMSYLNFSFFSVDTCLYPVKKGGRVFCASYYVKQPNGCLLTVEMRHKVQRQRLICPPYQLPKTTALHRGDP